MPDLTVLSRKVNNRNFILLFCEPRVRVCPQTQTPERADTHQSVSQGSSWEREVRSEDIVVVNIA